MDMKHKPTPLPRLLNKVELPRVKKNTLHRTQLLNFLTTNTDVKLVVISAPAGYGKTVLLSDYAAQGVRTCCWLTLDQSDCDPAIFLESLVEAIGRAFPEFSSQSQFLPSLVEALNDPEVGPEVCSRLLVNQLYQTVDKKFELIIDDYHLVENQPQINDLLSYLFDYLNDNCRVLLSTRTVCMLDLTSLMLQGDVLGLGVKDLRLSVLETETLLNQNYQLALSPEEIVTLTERTEGWIAGVLLSSNKILRHRINDISFSNREQLFTYLATQVLQQLPASLQSFLVQTSILPEMHVELCNQLLERTDSASCLQECERRLLFISRLETVNQGITYYRYHNLFQDYLQAELKNRDVTGYRILHRHCAFLARERGNISRMMWHFEQAEDFEAIIEVLRSDGENEIKAGHAQSVRNWLDALPAEMVNRHSELLLIRAEVLGASGQFNEAYELFDRVEKMLTAQLPGVELKLAQTIVIRGRMLRSETRYHLAVQTLKKGLDMLKAMPEFAEQAIYSELPGQAEPQIYHAYISSLAEAYLELGVCLGMESLAQPALEALETARLIYKRFGDKERLARIHHCLSLVYDGINDLPARQRHLEISFQYWQEVKNIPGLTNTLINLADLHLANANYEEAETVLKEALMQAEKAGYHVGSAYVLAFKGDMCRDNNQFTQAFDYYRQAEELASSSNEKRLIILVCREITSILRVLGDYEGAQAALNRALQNLSPPQRSSGFIFEVLRLHQIGLELDHQHFAEAKVLLYASSAFFSENDNKRELIIERFLHARLFFGLGKAKLALDSLVEALKYASGVGLQPVLKQEAFQSVPLLKLAQAKLSRQPQVQELVERLLTMVNNYKLSLAATAAPEPKPDANRSASKLKATSVAPPASKISAMVEDVPLIARAFGTQEVLVHGMPIHDWRTAKACELLFLLLDRAKPLHKEIIIDALWPNLSASQADTVFKSTIYRLRNALSPDWIKRDGSVYSLNVPYWYDVQQFEGLTLQANNVLEQPHPLQLQQALERYRAATELCRGVFLEGNYSNWCTERQSQLTNKHIEVLLKQAELELQLGQPEAALEVTARCLRVDYCNDAAHLLRLRIYQQQGNLTLLTQSYIEYCRILELEMSLDPSPEITAFYNHSRKQLVSPK